MKMLLSLVTFASVRLWPAPVPAQRLPQSRDTRSEPVKSHRSPAAGERQRSDRTRARAKAFRRNARPVLCREPAGRRRHCRNGGCGRSASGRAYAACGQSGPDRTSACEGKGPLRSAQELCAGFASGVRAGSHRGASVCARQRPEGIDRTAQEHIRGNTTTQVPATAHRRISPASVCSR